MNIDPNTLSEKQIKEALSLHCNLMGSYPYYYADEIARWKENPACLRVFEDTNSLGEKRLRAYTHTPLA
jgi:hypothetical protein